MQKVGWIGTGNMGGRMARRLMDARYKFHICDKIKANTDPLTTDGAILERSAGELAEKVDFLFCMIPNGAVLKDVILGGDGAIKTIDPHTIVIDMSTIDPRSSSEVNEKLEEAKVRFLRATVTGSTAFAAEGKLGIMASGPKDAYEAALPLLRILGNRQTYLGAHEEARYIKIIINMMVGNTMQMLAESLVVGEKVGVDWNTMIDLIADSAAASPIIKFKVDALKARDFSAMATSTFMEKDMNIALDIAKESELALPMTAVSRQFYTAMRANGLSKVDYSGIVLVNEKLNGIQKDYIVK